MAVAAIEDRAVRVAASRALGHDVDNRAELESLTELEVHGARSFDDLFWCPSLQKLTLVGAGPGALKLNAPLLSELSITCSAIDRLDFLPAQQNLHALELNFTLVEDAAPIATLPKLRRVRLLGNPWNTSIDALRAQLLARPAPPGVEISPRAHLDVNRALRARGFALSFGVVPGISWQLAAPGVNGDGKLAFAITGPERVTTELAGARDAADLLSRLGARHDKVDDAAWRFRGHWVSASAAGAAEWALDADLPPEREQALCRFIDRFAQQTFYRDLPTALDVTARAERVTLPAWLYAARGVLAGVDPTQRDRVKVLFDGFDAAEDRAEDDRWYHLGLLGYDNDDVAKLLRDTCGVFVIGQSARPGESQLVIDVSRPGEERIYETRYLTLAADRRAGRAPNATAAALFDNYATMLGHIVAVEIDGRVVHAGPYSEV
jgi:hypothetical protein